MSRLPVGILICAGSVLFILGHWEGIPVAAAGMGLAVWMLAREHGGYVRGAARLAEDMDRLMPSGAGVDARRVAPRTVWWWTVAAVLLTISATGFFATIDRVHEEPLPTGFAMTAMAIGCGMWLERLLRVWGSWRRVALWFVAIVASAVALEPISEWAAGIAVFVLLWYGIWSYPGLPGWERSGVRPFSFERGGVRLAGVDSGGNGPPVLLLHGLAGHTGEWEATTAALRHSHRAVALDARGHGSSDRHPADVSRAAHVADAIAVVEDRRLPPVVLVGQSLGGQTAICAAAARPDLVSGLVVIEAGPGGGQLDAAALIALRGRLEAWPGERRRNFDTDVMVRTMAAFDGEDCWYEWERVACPTLLVLGEDGGFAPGEAEEMLTRQPLARAVTIEGAGHDVHLDRPDAWLAVLTQYLTDAR